MTRRSKPKVLLFVVEGISEKDLLEPILDITLDKTKIEFTIADGDITVKNSSETVKSSLGNVVRKHINNTPALSVAKVSKIILLTDTDGCFIPDSAIYESSSDEYFRYEEEGIYYRDVEAVAVRNDIKKRSLQTLFTSEKISNKPLECYYFSCNLDHVFHDERNLDDEKKSAYALDFSEKYEGRETEFVRFFLQNNLIMSLDYKKSWKKIQEGNNSLHRYSNFLTFFVQNKEYLKEECKEILREIIDEYSKSD